MLTIRKANSLETNTLLQLTGAVIKESTAGYSENDYQKAVMTFSPLLTNGSYYLIAEEHNTLKGWVLLGPDFNPMHKKPTAGIFSVYVFPQYRGLKIGKKLMESAIKQLKSVGYKRVQLNVYANNPAKHLYENIGFKEVSSLMELVLD